MMMENIDAIIEAKAFAIQTKEWMRDCIGHQSCPGAMVFSHTITLFDENKRLQEKILELENKLKEMEFPDES